jgi:hypothetical protein
MLSNSVKYKNNSITFRNQPLLKYWTVISVLTQFKQDHSSNQESPVLQEWQTLQANFEFIEWPPRSPDMSRIENVCSEAQQTLQKTLSVWSPWMLIPCGTLSQGLGKTLLGLSVSVHTWLTHVHINAISGWSSEILDMPVIQYKRSRD